MEEQNDAQQELIFQLSMFEQQIQQMQQQMQAVEKAVVEMSSLGMGLDELVGKKDKEILAPIGRGIFAKAKLLSEELVVDIGGKNFVTKNIPDTKKLIDEQIEKLNEVKKELNENMESIGKEMEKVYMNALGNSEKHVCGDECGCGGEN